jgi:TrmH family RNA methyltransferase
MEGMREYSKRASGMAHLFMAAITSGKNPRIQQVLRLREKARERKEQNLFVIEGVRELTLALKGGIRVKEVFYCSQIIQQQILGDLKKKTGKTEWVEISKEAYEKIALRESTEGMIALAEMGRLRLEQIKLPVTPLILIVESVEKPGNLGALLRTADAAGVSAVLVCDSNVDLYNPSVVRSSLGCLFTQQVAVCSSEEAIAWLRKNSIKIFAGTPKGAKIYYSMDLRQPCAIAVGSEAEGLTKVWLNHSDFNIVIPMQGEIDSLNVSVSAAVILFESLRQRAV